VIVRVGVAVRARVRVVATVRQVVPVSRYMSTMRATVRRSNGMSVAGPDPVHLVAAGIVAVMSSAMAARKAEEGHGGHAGGSKNHAEDGEVHLSGWCMMLNIPGRIDSVTGML
jgi:hypothetical protein